MILLRQKMYTSKATKELRKKIIMKSGDIKRFKSEGYRTVERSKGEIENDVVEALKNKFGRGKGYKISDVLSYGPSNMPINEKITNKGVFKGQLYTGSASSRRKLDKKAREIYDHGYSTHLVRRGSELRYWE